MGKSWDIRATAQRGNHAPVEVIGELALRGKSKDNSPRPLSRIFALLSAFLAFFFTIAAVIYFINIKQEPTLWGLITVICLWVLLFAVGLGIWVCQHCFNKKWIGFETIEMVGGVSGAVIAAVTLILILGSEGNSDKLRANHEKSVEQLLEAQNNLLQEEIVLLRGRSAENTIAPPPHQIARKNQKSKTKTAHDSKATR